MISTKLATHIVVCIPHIVCHISGKHLLLYPHDCWFNPHFFPTSLCGVLVFDSVSRLLHLSHNNFVTHHLSHTTLSHIFFHTHNFVTHHLSLRDIHLRFAWQVWHLWHWAGSGGALGRAWARLVAGDAAQLCVAGVALGDIHLRVALRALGWLWWHAWTGLIAGDAAALCVAGVALGDIHLRFA